MHMKSTVTPEYKDEKDVFTYLQLVQEMLQVMNFVLTFGGYVTD